MNIIFAGRDTEPLIEELRKRSCSVEVIPLERLRDVLFADTSIRLVDAIVCSHIMYSAPPHIATPGVWYTMEVGASIQTLPDFCAMVDGRKWKGIPFIILKDDSRKICFEEASDFRPEIHRFVGGDAAFCIVRSAIMEHRQKLLSELDNLGSLVRYDHGRYQIGPALARSEQREGSFYSSAYDKRIGSAEQVLTVDRDAYGLQYEVELLEQLLNLKNVSERDLQQFFEEHPHFLSPSKLFHVLPHVRLELADGILVPDFILKPIVAVQRDSEWEVLDLKRPHAQLLVGKANRTRF